MEDKETEDIYVCVNVPARIWSGLWLGFSQHHCSTRLGLDTDRQNPGHSECWSSAICSQADQSLSPEVTNTLWECVKSHSEKYWLDLKEYSKTN